MVGASEFDEAWLFDPQTAGGLLIAVTAAKAEEIRASFAEAGEPALVAIGEIVGAAGTATAGIGRIEIEG